MIKVKRVAVVLLFGCLGLLAWGLTRSADDRTVVVGVEQFDYPPILSIRNGKVSGFARDVLDLFGKRRGYTMQYRPLPIPALYKALLNDQSIDLKFPDNPVWMSARRKPAKVVYSDGVLDFVDGVMVKQARLGGQLDALRRLGTIRGFDVGPYYERVQAGQIQLDQRDEVGALLRDGLGGSADGVFINVAVAASRLKQMGRAGELVYDPALPHNVSSYLVSSVKRPGLVREFNDFLRKNKAEIDALKRKYEIDFVQGAALAAMPAPGMLPQLPSGNSKQPLLTLCHNNLPPYAIGSGEWITDGSKFRVTRDILNEAGVRLRVLQLPWARCQLEAAAGRIDGVLPTFATAERDVDFLFSEPVMEQESVLFYSRKQFSSGLEWGSFDDLRGDRLGMLLGDSIEATMEKTLAGSGLLTRGNDTETLMKMLHHQRLDLVALDRAAGNYELGRLGLGDEIRASGRAINRRSAMLALSRKSPLAVTLLPRINQAIERLNAAGRLPR